MEKRLDVLLCEKNIFPSRQKAKEAIELGRVKINSAVVKKPSFLCDENATIEALPFEFVSRGGFKLQKALEEFSIDLSEKIVLDIGASTGGFSDVALQSGAKKVYCVDTGECQLSPKILNDPRAINMDKTNYLKLSKDKISDVNFVVIDVSFVSLTLLTKKLSDDFEHIDIIALIKPQFECGAEYARKHKGIVKDEKVHAKVIENVKNSFSSYGFKNLGIITSPIKGGDGNVEFLGWFKK